MPDLDALHRGAARLPRPARRLQRAARPLAGLVGAALLAALLAACSRPEPVAEPVRAVRTLTVAADSAGGQQAFAGEVRPRVESRLGFRVGGKMIERPAEVGQRVRTGQKLAQLDAADLQLGQQAATAAVRAAETSYALAAAEFRRFKELREQGFISAWELERRQAALDAQKAQLDQVRAQAGVQVNQTAYAVLAATAPGIVTAVEAEVGMVLAAGQPVVRIAHDGPRDAVFAVPEDGVAGMRALLGRAGALQVRAWGSEDLLPATVREVAAAADPATRTFQVKADLGRAPLQLGQTLTVLVELPRLEAVTRLPLTAVTQQQGQTAVWLLDPASMTVRPQPVAVAGADGNDVIVAAGLRPGQQVVTAGVHVLTAGQKVRLYTEPDRAPAAAPPSGGASAPAAAASR
ncbi:MAG: efflux RND transporter periplasmic adaptor subunit [Rubrivivax sp.]|nr:efflux RND transporter periplasmic adaptor subunit [Rubrivivax sp.]